MHAMRCRLAVAAPCSALAWLAPRERRGVRADTFASWETLQAYAADQEGEMAAGRGPQRNPDIEARYRRYFQWAKGRGHTGAQFVIETSQWRGEHGGPWVALEPNIVPYGLEQGIEHWILWYHPGTTPGDADVDLQPGAEVQVNLPEGCQRGRIRAARRSSSGQQSFDVVLDSGAVVAVGRGQLEPGGSPRRWAPVLRHVRLFLPELAEEEAVIFQNIPSCRSVPELAHAHVFIRPQSAGSREALRQLRLRWRMRSPWAEAERLGGRGREVSFEE